MLRGEAQNLWGLERLTRRSLAEERVETAAMTRPNPVFVIHVFTFFVSVLVYAYFTRSRMHTRPSGTWMLLFFSPVR